MTDGAAARARVYAAAAAGCAAFAVWGSLLPFDFHRVPLDVSVARFLSDWNSPIASWSLTDLVSNVMLFAPIGLFLTAALEHSKGVSYVASGVSYVVSGFSRIRAIGLTADPTTEIRLTADPTNEVRLKADATRGLAAMAALAAGVALSVAIEIGQAFVSWRIPSLVDVIAESFGMACGVAAWRIVGGELDVLLRSALERINRSSQAERWLIAYAAAFAVSWLLPGDFTLRPAEIGDKYFHHRLLLPFTPSPDAATPADLALLLVASIPLGVAAAVVGCRANERRSVPKAVAISTALLTLLEAAQALVFSRTTDTTALLALFAGTVIGACSTAYTRQSRVLPIEASAARVALVAVGSIAALAVLEWWPFDGFLDANAVRLQMTSWSLAPFRPPAHAFDLVPGAMFAAAAGAFFCNRLSVHYPRVQATLIGGTGAVLFVAIEAGRLLLPGPRPTLMSVVIKLLVLAASLTAMKLAASRDGARVGS